MWRSNRGCSPQHRRVTASSDARAEHLSSPDADQMGVLVAASHERRCAGDRLSGLVLLTRSRDASHPAAIPLRWAPVVSLPTVDIAETFGEAGWTGAESGWVLATCWRSSCVPQKIGGLCPAEDRRSLSLPSAGRAGATELALLRLRSASGTWRDMLLRVLRDEVFGRVEGTQRGQRHPRKDCDGWEVIDHEFGYRAELARILALIPLEGTETDAKVLASHLSLPLTKSVPPWPRRDRTA